MSRFESFREKVAASSPYGLKPVVTSRLASHYGTDYPTILNYIEKNPELGKTVPGSERVIAAEVVHAVREEMAVKLSDVIRRRTDLGAGGNPGSECLKFCAGLMAKELGWDKPRTEKEISETESAYKTVRGRKT
jgi:glycerol-3-phosphate dehydrogenase